MIIGGFGGKYFQESLALNCSNNTVQKTASQLPTTVFPFAVPTLSDGENLEVYTVDWTTYKLFRFKDEKWAVTGNLRANASYAKWAISWTWRTKAIDIDTFSANSSNEPKWVIINISDPSQADHREKEHP